VGNDTEPRPFRDLAQDDRRPIPDPTVLTTQALYREADRLQELIEQRIEGATAVIDQQFYKVEQQFELVERQRVEQKKDTKDAVDAALTAQKEAVREQTSASERSIAKSEAATTKQIDQLAVTFASTQESLLARIDELKERIIEVDRKAEKPVQQRIGAQEDRTGLYAAVGLLATLLVVGISIIGLVIAFHK